MRTVPASLTAAEYAEASCDCTAASPEAMGPHGVPENAPAVALSPAEALDTLYMRVPWMAPHRLVVMSWRSQHTTVSGSVLGSCRLAVCPRNQAHHKR